MSAPLILSQTANNLWRRDKSDETVSAFIRVLKLEENRFEFQYHEIDTFREPIFGLCHLDEKALQVVTDKCRSAWKNHLVEACIPASNESRRGPLLMQEFWDLAGYTDDLKSIMARLAKAGEDLFTSIFISNADDELYKIGEAVRALLSTGERCLSIMADDFCVPWCLLYTQAAPLDTAGADWRKEGFWGYNHIVSQTTKSFTGDERLFADNIGRVRLGVNVDQALALNDSVELHLKKIQTMSAMPFRRRTRRDELESAFDHFRSELEQVNYFLCHGSVNPPGLVLTGERIDSDDFRNWSKKRPLCSLIFINACQGGHISSSFFKNVSFELLRQGAVGVAGPQVDIPMVFAIQFADQVLEAFVTNSTVQPRLGRLMRDITRRFMDANSNPLGIVYSLYRGLNCRISHSPDPEIVPTYS